MSQLAVVILALFGQMERTDAIERAAHARAVAASNGKRIGQTSVVDPTKLAFAAHLRDQGDLSISEIVQVMGIARSSLYRHLRTGPQRRRPPRASRTPKRSAPAPVVVEPTFQAM